MKGSPRGAQALSQFKVAKPTQVWTGKLAMLLDPTPRPWSQAFFLNLFDPHLLLASYSQPWDSQTKTGAGGKWPDCRYSEDKRGSVVGQTWV